MLNVGIVFGGVSPEHEVSVISSLQAAHALDRSRYRPVPIYIAKSGEWFTGDFLLDIESYQDLDALVRRATPVVLQRTLDAADAVELGEITRGGPFSRPLRVRIDVMFLGLHGGEGENGGLQGLCETMNVPYTGSSVVGSAVGMDKVISKMLCRDQGIPVIDFVAFRESEWGGHEEAWLDRCEQTLGYPMIVKPSRLGSSIGISKADDRTELDASLEEAFRYDEKVIVEKAVVALREVNCSVLGDPNEARASTLEEPVRSKGAELLTFAEKYQRGGGGDGKAGGPKQGTARAGAKTGSRAAGMASLDRIIPAPLPAEQTRDIQALGVRIFQLFECAGVARIDFILDESDGQVYFNEINTIPGSFSFYLWEPSGVPFSDLVDRMIRIGLERHRLKNGRVRSYGTNLLSMKSLSGLKGAKTSG